MSNKGRLIVVSGPSGVGKGTVLKEVFRRSDLPLVLSVSATTRPPRPGETDGIEYWFLTKDDFRKKIKDDEFLEYFEVFRGGHLYGTLKKTVLEKLNEGFWVVLEIDVQGARKVREVFPDAITIFIEPESVDVLKERLTKRGTEKGEILQDRLNRATEELKHTREYDHRIVNAALEPAVQSFMQVLESQRRAP